MNPRSCIISPADWDASQRLQRYYHRPTWDSYHKALAEYYNRRVSAEIESRRLKAIIDPMLKIGGKEWKSDRGHHRVYFEAYRLSRGYNELSIPGRETQDWQLDGYYDVVKDEFVPKSWCGLSAEEFRKIITDAAAIGSYIEPPPEHTLCADGTVLQEGMMCMIISERGVHWRRNYKPTSRPLNIGRICIARRRMFSIEHKKHRPDHGDWKYPTAWWVVPEDESKLFQLQTNHFIIDYSLLLIDSICLLPVRENGRMSKPEQPANPYIVQAV